VVKSRWHPRAYPPLCAVIMIRWMLVNGVPEMGDRRGPSGTCRITGASKW